MKNTSSLLRAAQVIKPHVPLIRFRRHHEEQTPSSQPPVSKGGAASGAGGGRFFIEERQLPTRFRRQVLGDNEIASINSGGAF